MMAPLPRDEIAATPTSSSPPGMKGQAPRFPAAGPPLLPVNRQWIAELLQKHHRANADSPGDAAVPSIIPLVLAPMVDQSDLPFRLLCRRYGSNLCFTPMIHAKMYCHDANYRRKFRLDGDSHKGDRPLIAQLCGSDVAHVIGCALQLAPYVDGIDINCGCPQGIARRGHYGAFLLEQPTHLLMVVKHLLAVLPVPLSVKVRLLPPMQDESVEEAVERSLKLYGELVDAGIHLLTVHGRNRKQKGAATGAADWHAIRRVVQVFGHRIPILANGSIGSYQDAMECIRVTGVDGVMSSEAILEYPPLFDGGAHPQNRRRGRLELAREYLQLAQQYPPDHGGQASGLKCVKSHLHRMLHADLSDDPAIRQAVLAPNAMDELDAALDLVEASQSARNHDASTETLSWYVRHRNLVRTAQGITMRAGDEKRQRESLAPLPSELLDDTADCLGSLFDG